MNQSGTDSGQSMEDILASIRRIIAEGEQDAKDGSPPAAAADAAKAAPKADVFELTQIVQDDGSVITVGSESPKPAAANDKAEPAAAEVKAEAAAIVEKLATPEALAEKPVHPMPAAEPPPAAPGDAKVESAMAALSRLMDIAKAPAAETPAAEPERRSGAVTLEELVRDAVKPMLRQWLDANLPPLVEKAVREAVERLAKRAG
jgi:hypothetical protein